jgi:hypothetical protein
MSQIGGEDFLRSGLDHGNKSTAGGRFGDAGIAIFVGISTT